jgi:lipoyl(octanoyl) transferase
MKVIWKKSEKHEPYETAISHMESVVEKVVRGECEQTIWFLEHKDVYTAGTSADDKSLLEKEKFDVCQTGRGGDYTYHGPGQRVVYFILDLKKIFEPSDPDLRAYISKLEEVVINALERFGIKGERRVNRVGIWVVTPGGEKKIAAIGVRVRKWVAYHGIAINIDTDLSNFDGIVPCGISQYGVTSFKDLGKTIEMDYFDKIMKEEIKKILSI